jgi:hypothetical protein
VNSNSFQDSSALVFGVMTSMMSCVRQSGHALPSSQPGR